MPNMPQVSVIIPVYNAEVYLEKCIKSILQMDFKNYELILVDDGSEDKSWSLCCQFAEQESRIKVLQQDNGGPSVARNSGLKVSSGKWIVFVDSDDMVRPKYISDLIDSVRNDPTVVMVVSGMQVYRHDKSAEKIVFSNQSCPISDYVTIWKDNRLFKYGHPFGKLYRKDIIEKNNLQFDKTVCLEEDCIFMMQYLMACMTIKDASVVFTEKINYDYMIHSGSVSTRRSTLTQERSNYEAYRKTVFQLKEVFKINMETFDYLSSPISYYADRVLNAIAELPTRKERLSHMSIVNRKEYRRYKRTPTLAALVLKLLFVSNHWYLYDLLRAKIN